MRKRHIFIIAGLIFFVVVFGFSIWLLTKPKEEVQSSPVLPLVNVIKAQNEEVQTWVQVTGRLEAKNKIDIYSEVGGIFLGRGKAFEVGVPYQEGEVLISINSDEVRQQILAQKGSLATALGQVVPDLKLDYPDIYPEWKQYLMNFDYTTNVRSLPNVNTEQQRLFLTGRNIYAQFHNLKQLEDRLGKYTIRAPFDGVVTSTNIKEGSLVQPGMKLGEFEKTGSYEMEASVNSAELKYVETGDTIFVKPVKGKNRQTGIITQINEQLDPETQTVRVLVKVEGPDLRGNMYMEGKLPAEFFKNALMLPRELLLPRSRLFAVRDSVVVFQEVVVYSYKEDSVIVGGVPEGALLLTEERSPAFAGTRVSPVLVEDL